MKQRVLFLGDLYYDYTEIKKDIRQIGAWIRKNGLVTVLNLEGALRPEGAVPVKKRGPNLAFSDNIADVLCELNAAGVCLSNNHMMDFGDKGLRSMLEVLKNAGIAFTGAGMTLDDALRPMILESGGIKTAILNFGWDQEETVYAGAYNAGCSPREDAVIFSELEKIRPNADRCVVFMHWGFEYNRLPMPFDIDLAHRMAENGADLVIGSHPHNVQPKELFAETPVYYSLGNYYFSSRRERFQKQFNEPIRNACDYGIGVLWDPKTAETEEVLVFYDREKKETRIVSDKELLCSVLEDITGIDYLSDEYQKAAFLRRQNRNPILATDKEMNKKALQRFAVSRKLRSFGKKLFEK